MTLNRRQFGIAGLAGLAFAGLPRIASAMALDTYRNEVPGFGDLIPDPLGYFDLPAGFRYSTLSSFGEVMDDGFFVPDHFDGMGCFPLAGGRLALVRNHELKPEDRESGATRGLPRLDQRLAGERFFGADNDGRPLPGGTSTIILDRSSGGRQAQYLSLAGTAVNCAGGATPWGSWLSCEESVLKTGEVERDHGWLFEVPAAGRGIAEPVPLTAMGRFRHEAAAVDPRSGIVYLTEDRDDSLFYRFLPHSRRELASGGKLQALSLGRAGIRDTRNWDHSGIEVGTALDALWIDVDGVHSPDDDLRYRGHAAGAALFARGEDVKYANGELYFTCTSGGAERLGQVMKCVTSPREGRAEEAGEPGRLQLFVESRDPKIMDYADNLTVAPFGDLIVCEDRSDGECNHLKGITPEGRVYTFARLNADTELAGVCFSPDGSTMFVNAYRPGRTLSITGPWNRVSA